MARTIPRHDFGALSVRPPHAYPGQRIGIMGGTFNPPHDGHRIVAETALRRLALDQIWWAVTPGNPLKSNGGLPPLANRMAAARRFARGPRMKLTAFERELGTPYTAATLAFLKRRFHGVDFVWVMGADNLASFHRWQHWRRITGLMPVAVVDRPGWRLKSLAGPAASALSRHRVPERFARLVAGMPAPAWTFLTSRLSELSSTKLRNHAARQSLSKSTTL